MSCKLATVNGQSVSLTPELLALAVSMQDDPAFAHQSDEMLARVCIPGLAFATLDGGTLIAALGIIPVWPGRALGWMFPTPIADKRQLTFTTRLARGHFDRWQRDPAFRRIEIMIRDDRPWRESFANALGMTECFGPMRAFDTAGRDYWMYARVAP